MTRNVGLVLLFAALIGVVVVAVVLSTGRPAGTGKRPSSAPEKPDEEPAAVRPDAPGPEAPAAPGEGPLVAGVVLGPDGRPMEGAWVTIDGEAGPAPRRTTTAADGRFALRTAGGPCRIRAGRDGFAPSEWHRVGTKDETGVVLELSAAGTVRGLVIETGGIPVAGAKVSVADANVLSGEDGRFELTGFPRAKEAEVVAEAAGYEEAKAPVVLDAGGAATLAEPLVLVPKPGFGGRVFDPAGNPLAGVAATAMRGLFDQDHETSDGAGRYWFAKADGGEWGVRLAHPEYLPEKLESVRPEEGRRTLLSDVRLRPGGEITGRATGPDGSPVAGARVAAYPAKMPSDVTELAVLAPSAGSGPRVTAPDGTFRVPGLATGEHTLWVVAEGFRPLKREGIAVEVPEKTVVDVVLDRGKSISGVVLDAAGAPVAGASLAVQGDRSVAMPGGDFREQILRSSWASRATTGADGRFTLSGFEESAVTVAATAEGYADAEASNVAPGTSNLAIRLLRPGRVSGTVVDAATEEPIEGVWVNVPGASARTDAEGRFALSGATPGDCELSATAEDYVRARVPVTVKAGEEIGGVTVRMSAGEQLVVLVTRAADGSPVEKAHVRVSGAEGADRDTDPGGMAVLRGLVPGPVTVHVSADGLAAREVEGVPVPAAEPLRVALGLGGSVRVRVLDDAGRPAAGRMVLLGRGGDMGGGQNTDSEGRTVFAHVEPGEVVVALVAFDASGGFGFESRTRKVVVVEGEEVSVEFGAETEVRVKLTGRLLDRGKPVAGRMVVLFPADMEGGIAELMSGFKMVNTDSEGRFSVDRLAPGRYWLMSGPPGGEEMGAGIPVTIGESGDVREDFELPSGRLSGKVTSAENGAPVADAKILLVDAEGARRPATGLAELLGLVKGQATSASDGGYAVENAGVGSLYAQVSAPGFAARIIGPIDLTEEGRTLDVALERGAAVTVRVKGPAGEPVPGADVILFDDGNVRVMNMDDLNKTTDAEGKAEVRLERGTYRAVAQASNYAPASERVAAGRDGEVVVALSPGGSLAVTATSEAGPVAGAKVRLFAEGGAEVILHVTQRTLTVGVPSRRTAADGTLTIEHVPAGRLRVTADAPDGRRATVDVVVEEGATATVPLAFRP